MHVIQFVAFVGCITHYYRVVSEYILVHSSVPNIPETTTLLVQKHIFD